MSAAPAEGWPTYPLAGPLFETMLERARIRRYDPWADLWSRSGVDITWHLSGKVGRFKNALGLTRFSNLQVSLLVGMNSAQMRGTLAHELVHLDRGPFGPAEESLEERRVETLAAKRLIDPVVFDLLMDVTDGKPTRRARVLALDVGDHTFAAYKNWRKRVKVSTAAREWEMATEPAVWPPKWLGERSDKYPEAARFAGAL